MPIKVLDGPLYQWDKGRFVVLTGKDAECEQVHFAPVHHARKALVVLSFLSEYGTIAPIPNSLLARPEDIIAWTHDDDVTYNAVRMNVNARPKPDDYIYVPTEIYGYDAIVEMVADAIGDITERVDYVRLNNKPKIEGVELVGDRHLVEFGIELATVEDVDGIFEEE